MPYMALEKRGEHGFDSELESKDERINWDGYDIIELIGWIDDNRVIRVTFAIDDLPEGARRKIAEEEIKKAAELLHVVKHVVRMAVKSEEG